MRVFVAGGTGVIGRSLIPMLITAGHQVTATTRSPGKAGLLRSLGAEPAIVDGLDRGASHEAVARARPDVIIDMLAPDVVFYGDGGGKGPATTVPIYGRERVARLLRGLGRRAGQLVGTVRPAQVNGQPGVISFDGDGKLFGVLAFDVLDGQVLAIRSVVNPDKLRHLGATSEAFVRGDR